jgi:hypothetical protein
MQKANMLLFIIPNADNNELILTGKLFEYLASGTSMLSIGPINGNAAKIIASCNRGRMIDYEDKEKIKKHLLAEMDQWYENGQISRKLPINLNVENYSRRGQTESLVRLLNSLHHE